MPAPKQVAAVSRMKDNQVDRLVRAAEAPVHSTPNATMRTFAPPAGTRVRDCCLPRSHRESHDCEAPPLGTFALVRRLLLMPLLLFALAGCGGDEDNPEDAVGSAPTPAAGETTTPAPQPSAIPTPTASAGEVGPADDPASTEIKQTVRARGATNATIDVAVLGLETSDKLATLTLSFSPHYADAPPDEEISIYDMNGEDPLYVSLLDAKNLRRYVPVMDSEGQTLATDEVGASAINNDVVTARYTFAAPPADVSEVDVVVGNWPPFPAVPITR